MKKKLLTKIFKESKKLINYFKTTVHSNIVCYNRRAIMNLNRKYN